jgi:hypothetical protein
MAAPPKTEKIFASDAPLTPLGVKGASLGVTFTLPMRVEFFFFLLKKK